MLSDVLDAHAFGRNKPAPAVPAQAPLTIDQITERLNQSDLSEILGPIKTDFLAGKSVACASTSASPLTEPQAAEVVSKYSVTLGNYVLDWLGTPSFDLSSSDDSGNTEVRHISVSSLGVSISQGDKSLITEMNFGDALCTLGIVTRHEYTPDGRPLLDLTMSGKDGVKETDMNTPPKTLRAIYGSDGYDAKTLEQLEQINEDPSRIGIAVIDIGVDYNDPVFAYKTDRNEVGLDLVENDFLPSDLGGPTLALIGDIGHGTAVSGLAVAGE